MPKYTYDCSTCGPFTMRQSMNEQHEYAYCPHCGDTSTRVFNAFQTYKMDGKLKQRIEKVNNLVLLLKISCRQISNKKPHKEDLGWQDTKR